MLRLTEKPNGKQRAGRASRTTQKERVLEQRETTMPVTEMLAAMSFVAMILAWAILPVRARR
jgi:hypothetical protein